ncbi:hypothetical protein G6F57_012454 [Rhizopus arrhizus]|uniref:Uncharacterized protein n=1 Tax=Rhizopus oryzae TaxID=64495 RepID=A0A9P6WYU7_RHIOR|nr:hypothetical protein G6F30_011969 [Rhizopus arrhizus]KAG1396047.1 hypothetical protein G6F58_011815 [Rhizopus delemar]KAG0975700.1 hypothetical protein G6F29_011343 [Rhizopus arrhizus]KAG0980002.1 hypothetical protein G6F28_011750 [Rhizopus arrhizus]KAG1002530.1 hypothetical protein G6F27_011879 [Rhizopus arrhizus]
MTKSNGSNSSAAGSSSSNNQIHPDNVRRMSDISILSSETQSSGMTSSAVSSGSVGPEIAAPSIPSSIEELDSIIIGATQVTLNFSVRLLSTTPDSEEDNMMHAKYEACSNDLKRQVHTRDLLQRAMNHVVPTAWTGAPQVVPAALNVVPPNLPLMQWKGAVFGSSVSVSVDIKHCLKYIKTHYGVGLAEEKATPTTKLLHISMSAAETVDQYVERSINLRRLAQIQGRCPLTYCVLIGLQADI